MLQTDESKTAMLNVGTQSNSLLMMNSEDLNLDQGTVNFINLGLSPHQAHNIRTAVCNLL